ncbi:MAG: hypothetical protein JNK05_28180 [Myxococcales bacterium]|nr:hypothetical protein [Myxococcales bacterium]
MVALLHCTRAAHAASLLLAAITTEGCRFWSVRPVIEQHLRDQSDAREEDAQSVADASDVIDVSRVPDASERCSIDNGGCGDPAQYACVEEPALRCVLRCDADRREILRDIGRIDTRTFLFSPAVVHGDNACPLLVTSSGRPFAAFAREGLGRVVWFGHDAALTTLAMQPDGSALVRNALVWASRRPSLAGVRVGLEPRNNLGTLATIVVAEGGAPRAVAASALDASQIDVWVTASTLAPTTRAELDVIDRFVRQGGGLVHGGQAWNWARTRPGEPASAYPGNGLVRSAGIFIVPTSLAAADTAVGATITPTDFSHARRALDHTVAHLRGERTLSMSEQTLAAVALVDPIEELPLDTPFWSAARELLSFAMPTPTRDRPLVTAAQPVAAVQWLALGRAHREAPDPWLPTAISASDFPGDATGPTSVVRSRIELATPTIESRFVYAQSGARVWRSLGAYAPAGASITISIPPSAASLGLEAQIGMHDRVLSTETQWERAPSLARVVALSSERTTMKSAFGGLVYVRVAPMSAGAAIDVTVEGAMVAPRYTPGADAAAFLSSVASSGAPWGEIEGERVSLVLPRSVLRAVTDPRALIEHWDAAVAAMTDLAGVEATAPRPERVVFDRQIAGGSTGDSGYPATRQIDRAPVSVDLDALRREGEWGTYYVIARRFQSRDWTIPGSQDAIPALFNLYAIERVSGRTIADAPYAPLAAASRAARVEAYVAGGRNYGRDFNGNVALEMYLQLIEGFGWAAFRQLVREYQALPELERPTTDDARIQQWALRSSRVFGRDLSPFYGRWGLPIASSTRTSTAMYPAWTEAPARP